MGRTNRTICLLAILALLLGAAPVAGSQPSELERKRSEAEALQARIEEQGRRLSIADEEFNQARIERERLGDELEESRRSLAAAERRWSELKTRLGERVRVLYKHPGAWAETLLQARSFGDLDRARHLAGSVLGNDTELLMRTERAREEMEATASQVAELRSSAREKEEDLASRREQVQSELQAQQALLEDVEGDVAEMLTEQRNREAEEAARRAAEAAEEARRIEEARRVEEAADAGSGSGSSEPAPRAPDPPRQPRGPAEGTSDDEPSGSSSGSSPSDPNEDASPPPPHPRASEAVAVARDQIGKPYEWGADGPDSYDCSGLTMYAWGKVGVSLPHSSRSQYASLPKVPLSQIQTGDLLFFGNPIHHVGIYEGGGVMIEAPYSGEKVRRRSIHRSDFAGAARPR